MDVATLLDLPVEVFIQLLAELPETELQNLCATNREIHARCSVNKNFVYATKIKNEFLLSNMKEIYKRLCNTRTYNALLVITNHDGDESYRREQRYTIHAAKDALNAVYKLWDHILYDLQEGIFSRVDVEARILLREIEGTIVKDVEYSDYTWFTHMIRLPSLENYEHLDPARFTVEQGEYDWPYE